MTTTAIKAKYSQGVLEPSDANLEDKLWLDDAAQEMATRLNGIEANLHQEEIGYWHKTMSRVAKPARYIEGRGVVIERL